MSNQKDNNVKAGISMSDFAKSFGSPMKYQKEADRKNKFRNIKEFFQGIGLLPTLKGSISKGSSGVGHVHGGGGGPRPPSGSDFRASHRVDTTSSKPSHEDMVVAHMAHDAYMDLVDGKGDDGR